jgi:hypothetical protein
MILAALMASLLGAQWGQEETRQADVRGGGGDRGKCTVEVEVDDIAEIEIRGDSGRIRTISGQPAVWRRFVCNQRMPAYPGEFRFRGIDGRGRQQLVREPGGRGGAVVRIEDPKGGREGYTFDLEWRGGSDAGRGDGWWDGRGRRGGGNWSGGSGNWNRDLRFRARGEGYYRNRRGDDERLEECQVEITRNGDLEARFETARRERLNFRGRVTRVDRDRVFADVSGGDLRGALTMVVTDDNRVRDVSIDGTGRDRFELRWRD